MIYIFLYNHSVTFGEFIYLDINPSQKITSERVVMSEKGVEIPPNEM